jgi:hypothetical protein
MTMMLWMAIVKFNLISSKGSVVAENTELLVAKNTALYNNVQQLIDPLGVLPSVNWRWSCPKF